MIAILLHQQLLPNIEPLVMESRKRQKRACYDFMHKTYHEVCMCVKKRKGAFLRTAG